MQQFSIGDETGKHVVVTEQNGKYTATLYVGGDTITTRRWTGKTEEGARRWAESVLSKGIEPFGAQCIRKMHADANVLLKAYDEEVDRLEDPVKSHVVSCCKSLVKHMEALEKMHQRHYKDLEPLEDGEQGVKSIENRGDEWWVVFDDGTERGPFADEETAMTVHRQPDYSAEVGRKANPYPGGMGGHGLSADFHRGEKVRYQGDPGWKVVDAGAGRVIIRNSDDERVNVRPIDLQHGWGTWQSSDPFWNKALPSEDISPEKARQILKDGTAQGKPLTEAQRRMFGAAAGKAFGSNGSVGLEKALWSKDRHSKDRETAKVGKYKLEVWLHEITHQPTYSIYDGRSFVEIEQAASFDDAKRIAEEKTEMLISGQGFASNGRVVPYKLLSNKLTKQASDIARLNKRLQSINGRFGKNHRD